MFAQRIRFTLLRNTKTEPTFHLLVPIVVITEDPGFARIQFYLYLHIPSIWITTFTWVTGQSWENSRNCNGISCDLLIHCYKKKASSRLTTRYTNRNKTTNTSISTDRFVISETDMHAFTLSFFHLYPCLSLVLGIAWLYDYFPCVKKMEVYNCWSFI